VLRQLQKVDYLNVEASWMKKVGVAESDVGWNEKLGSDVLVIACNFWNCVAVPSVVRCIGLSGVI
jgi:hypothetical protein